MRSPDELAARVRDLERQLTDQTQHLSVYQTFAAAEELRVLTWALGTTLPQALQMSLPAPSASQPNDDDVPSETTETSEEVDRYATLVTSPILRPFGYPSLLMLGLPPVYEQRYARPTASVIVTRTQAHQLRELVIPDPWGSASPGASARVLVPAQARKSAS